MGFVRLLAHLGVGRRDGGTVPTACLDTETVLLVRFVSMEELGRWAGDDCCVPSDPLLTQWTFVTGGLPRLESLKTIS